MKTLTKGAKILIIMATIRSIIDVFESVYISTELSKISGVPKMSMYYIVKYAACGLCACLAGGVIKKRPLTVLRIGIFADIVYLLAFSRIQDNMYSIVTIGVLHGVSLIAYYLPLQVITADAVLGNERHTFLATESVIAKIVALVMPMTLGAFAERNYKGTLLCIGMLATVQLFVSISMTNQKTIGEKSKYELLKLIAEMVHTKKMRDAFVINLLRGVSIAGTQAQLLNVVIYASFGSETTLGVVSSIVAMFSMITLAVWAKLFKGKKYGQTCIVVTSVYVVITVIDMFVTSNEMIIATKMAYEVMISILAVIISNFNYSVASGNTNATERFVMQEVGLNTGRICSWIIVLVAAKGVSSAAVALMWLNVALIFLAVKVYNEFRRGVCSE